MDMYPYVEALKVGAAYAALFYVWPCILFRNVLRNRGLTFRFLFCGIVQPLLISTAILTLGLFHILNVWLVQTLFWGSLAVSVVRPLIRKHQQGDLSARLPLRALLTRSYGWKLFLSRIARIMAVWWKKIWQQYRKRTVEYIVLAVIVLFGMAFFLNGAFHDYSFGCYDQYVHYRWTRGLLEGEIFSEGIYPEGMHCFLYALHALFRVSLHSCVVFLAGIHNSSTFILAAYCLLKELLGSRHTPLFVLAAWLVFDGIGPAGLDAIWSVSRMAWTLPEEFTLYLIFLCPLVILRYFRERDKLEKWYQDENLLLLTGGVALAASTHTYVLIMAFLTCCAVHLVHYRELLPFGRIFKLTGAALSGVMLGGLPMLAAYAMGMNLQDSLRWGIRLVNGTAGTSANLPDTSAASDIVRYNPLKELYEGGYVNLFGGVGAVLMLLLSLFIIVLAAAYLYVCRREKPGKTSWLSDRTAAGYLILTAAFTLFVLLYAMPYMGLPELMSIDRLPCTIQLFAAGTVGIVIDLLILWVERLRGRELSKPWMALGCVCLYLLAYVTDFRQSTLWYLQRYNASVKVTDQIMDNYPEWNYAIVSLYDAVYQVNMKNHAWHLSFLDDIEGKEYAFTQEYIFIYVEKHPLLRGQEHFPAAPRWLAKNNYEMYEGLWNQSQCPDILKGEISEELAREEITYDPGIVDDDPGYLTTRSIISSKVYRWCQDFISAHPAEMGVYYEDDDFVCYVIHQNPDSPLNLATGKKDGK